MDKNSLKQTKKPKILVIATGSVAVIKTKQLVQLLKAKYQVEVIVSATVAKHYQESSTLATLNENPNLRSFPEHIKWAKWANLIVVAPASANSISKFYHCQADNFASNTLLASRQPIMFVPAMNTYMYQKLVQRQIINKLTDEGHMFVGPVVGKLWEGETGLGKMVEPKIIAEHIDNYFAHQSKATILLPYGASKVFIDPIRYLTNTSQGTMGRILANTLRLAGFEVKSIDIGTMTNQAFLDYAKQTKWDIYLSPAAFADFAIIKNPTKIKKANNHHLNLQANVDVISTLKKAYPKRNFFAFKLDQNFENALNKKIKLNLDGIIWNDLRSVNNFQSTGIIVFGNKQIPFTNLPKNQLATLIAKQLTNFLTNKTKS